MNLDALIVTPADLAAIDAINATETTKQLQTVEASDGRRVLSASILTDCALGQTWANYGMILTTLTRETLELAPSDIEGEIP